MSSPTERLTTAVADRYRIERHLGEGGMATVYLAHDLKHDRKVALKVLRPELAAVIGAERFLAEIKTTANLQHPNILPLFDSGDADGQLFYVMPYVEGETLRDRITHEKQLPVEDVVRLGAEVASALDYAHRQGVIHRDIKPENILIHDGRALMADFGIALAVSTAGKRMTETGMSVGTPHYMSPEQAMGGHDVTAKSDVYALGATLYEALVGEPPFTGATAQAIIARIVTEEPRPLRTQRKTIPLHVEGAVLTALQRLPADRFATAAAFGEALEGRGSVPERATRPSILDRSTGVRPSGRRLGLEVASFATLALVAAWGWLRAPPEPPVERRRVALGVMDQPGSVGGFSAIAPDGSAFVYGDTVGGPGLWIKERDEADPRKLAAVTSTGALPAPSFSPDGKWIAYTDGKLKRVARAGGEPVLVSDSAAVGGAAWLRDGTIVFNGSSELFRTTAEGGAATVVLTADSAGGRMLRVTPVPGAGAVLVGVSGASPRLIALDLRSGAVHEVAPGAAAGWIVPGGILVYSQTDGTLLAAPFDFRKLTLDGPPVTVFEGIGVTQLGPDVALGMDGTVLYGEGGEAWTTRLSIVSVTRDGSATLLDTAWSGHVATNSGVALSPDGTRLALSLTDSVGARSDIYVVRLPNGPTTRLTFEGTENIRPAWSSDGETLLYVSNAGGEKEELWTRRGDGSGRPVRVLSKERPIFEGAWSPDGKWIVYRTDDAAVGHGDILAVPTQGDTTPLPLATTAAEETGAAVSPDGRWLAYASDASGRKEIYVVPFPGGKGGGLWQVSTEGGAEPRWSHDGRELFYRNASARIVAVAIDTTGIFHSGTGKILFGASRYWGNDDTHFYAVSPGDLRFLMLRATSQGTSRSNSGGRAVLVRNWLPEIQAKLKGG